MSWLRRLPRRVPVTITVPALVAGLMILVGAGASELVLSRLASSQERQLSDLAGAYLDGLEASLTDPVLRQDSWEVYDTLDRARSVYAGVHPLETTVTDENGVVLASSSPRSSPIGSPVSSELADAATSARPNHLQLRPSDHTALAERTLEVEGRNIGHIYARLDISPLLTERNDVLLTLVYSNAVLTLAIAALGWVLVRRMVSPMKTLVDHLSAAAAGDATMIPDATIDRQGVEWARVFRGFNRMAGSAAERESLLARVADEERLASLGRLASSVAHEINNPLGGILNAVDTVRVHGSNEDVRTASIDLIDRGLRGIRDVVRSILASYREDRESRNFAPSDLEDVRALVRPEVRRKALILHWNNGLSLDLPVNAFAFRQVVLNLLLNACKAAPHGGCVRMAAELRDRELAVVVEDSGPGLPSHIADLMSRAEIETPAVAGLGIGLWVTRRIVRELAGSISSGTSQLGGARIQITVPLKVSTSKEVELVA